MQYEWRPLRQSVDLVHQRLQRIRHVWVRVLAKTDVRIADLNKRQYSRRRIFDRAARQNAAGHCEHEAGSGPGTHALQKFAAVIASAFMLFANLIFHIGPHLTVMVAFICWCSAQKYGYWLLSLKTNE